MKNREDSGLLYHGSWVIVPFPDLAKGKANNDYGRGFYCTAEIGMAREWACKDGTDGFVNTYQLNKKGLSELNLADGTHTVLNWIAMLLKNRTFHLSSPLAADARDYLIAHFSLDPGPYDLVTGYRADDSYFQYAEAFVQNTLSLRGLGRALNLGRLGLQTALVSEKAFQQLRFVSAEPVKKERYYPKFIDRDISARMAWKNDVRVGRAYRDDLFVLDILREEIRNDDPRVQ